MKNIAIIGAGQIFETVHLQAINERKDIGEIYVVEKNLQRKEELLKKYPYLIIYEELDLMLKEQSISDAIVCVPNKFHFEVTVKLLEARINVLCEKPPAISSKEAFEMWQIAKKNNVKLFYNFHLRQIKSYDYFKNHVKDSYSIDLKALRRRGIPGWGTFINKEIQGGGALIDLGSHYLDLVLSLLESYQFESIQALTDDYIGKNESTGDFGSWESKKFTVENFCSVSLKSTFLLSLQCAFAHNISEKDNYQAIIYTHQGRLELLNQKHYDSQNQLIFDGKEEIDQQKLRIKSSSEFLNESYHNMCDGKHGYLIQELIEKIYESAGNINE
ncbi:MAG: Gfo/Idh/MocA family protein [Lactovum sp.]